MGWKVFTSKPLVLHARTHLLTNSVFMSSVKLSFEKFAEDETDVKKVPVMLLHGLLGNKKHWRSIGKTLLTMTERVVYSVDLRNHGKSPHSSTHNYKAMAEDLETLLVTQKLDKSFFVGHSMGGRAAMTLALTKPKLVHGLVVVDISPCSNCAFLTETMKNILIAMDKIDLTKFKGAPLVEVRNKVKSKLSTIVSDDIILRALTHNVTNRNSKKNEYFWKCNVKVLIDNYEGILELPSKTTTQSYQGPTLFIGGQLSEFIEPDDLPKIREKFPNTVLTYIEKAGHNVHADDLKGFLELVIKFIRGNN